jgi:hypothetical protein
MKILDQRPAAHQAARAFDASSQAAKHVEQAAAAFGKQGEDNGVEVGFGTANELPKSDGPKGDNDSPDGLLINCTFDTERLKGDALARAIAHVGTHISDLRDPQSSAAGNAYELEYRAWQTTVLSSIAMGQKTLTSPGGYLLWNSGWAAADRGKMMDEGIKTFLTNWELLNP